MEYAEWDAVVETAGELASDVGAATVPGMHIHCLQSRQDTSFQSPGLSLLLSLSLSLFFSLLLSMSYLYKYLSCVTIGVCVSQLSPIFSKCVCPFAFNK